MIVPMKCLALLCLNHDRDKVVDKLQSLGVVHIALDSKPDSDQIVYKQRCLQDVDRAIQALNSASKDVQSQYDLPTFTPKKLLSAVVNELDHLQALEARYDGLKKDVTNLLPWGNFKPDQIQSLEANGVHLYLCTTTPDKFATLTTEYVTEVVHRTKNQVWFAVVSLEPIPLDTLPLAQRPETITLEEAQNLLIETEDRMAHVHYQLSVLAKQRALLTPLRAKFEDELAYAINHAGMTEDESGNLIYLRGYVPVDEVENVKTFASQNGCAVMFSDPTPDELPPTQLKNSTFVNIVKPLFSFIGITPGYREWDVSACVLVFFTIFVAMITNDAGYGLIFTAIALLGWLAVRKNRTLWPLMGFLTLEGIACVVWGVAVGSYFGMSDATLTQLGLGSLIKLGSYSATQIPWLADAGAYEGKDLAASRLLNIQYFCFALAFFHLSFARLWKARLDIQAFNIIPMIANLGWIVLLLGNMLLAANFVVASGSAPSWTIYLYYVGVPMVLVAVNWKDIGAIFQAPLGLINGFVDTLSYIRLYAVGLAGACIASNFNQILAGLADGPVMTAISGIALTAGHVLNIVLVLMAIMVHAIRLNALEFSNHMGLEWSGYDYNPFNRKNPESAQNTTQESHNS